MTPIAIHLVVTDAGSTAVHLSVPAAEVARRAAELMA
jgi:hypothetical protein